MVVATVLTAVMKRVLERPCWMGALQFPGNGWSTPLIPAPVSVFLLVSSLLLYADVRSNMADGIDFDTTIKVLPKVKTSYVDLR